MARKLALIAVLLAVAPGNRAEASCNGVPERPPEFHGDRGTINRAFVSAGDDVVLQLPDSQRRQGRETALTADNLLITITYKPTVGLPRTVYVAGGDACRELEKPVCFLERLFCHPRKTCFKGSDVGLYVDPTIGRIEFRFPQTGLVGPVAIAASRTGDRKGLRSLAQELQNNSCGAVVGPAGRSKDESGFALCIDKFTNAEVTALGDVPPANPKFVELMALASPYDYSEVCSSHVGGGPPCQGGGNNVPYTVDSKGNVQIQVDWSHILRTPAPPMPGRTYDTRELLASTAVDAVRCTPSPGCTPGPDRIYIPSSNFLLTTDTAGQPFTVVPTFVPGEAPTPRPHEQTFFGTADHGASTLTFMPRVQWDHVCSGGGDSPLACEQDSDCPSAQSCTRASAQYFACDGGTRNKLPCTQTIQCPGGSGCHLLSKVKGWCILVDGTLTTTPCGQDSDCGTKCGSAKQCMSNGTPTGPACSDDHDCGMCGPGLFEFRNRVNGSNGGMLPRIATVRGVCDGGSNVNNVCTKNSDCGTPGFLRFLGVGARCVTYRAEADAYLPAPTP